MYIVRVDSKPALYFGPFKTRDEARDASNELQDRFEHETGTYLMLADVNDDVGEAVEFNDPNYVEA